MLMMLMKCSGMVRAGPDLTMTLQMGDPRLAYLLFRMVDNTRLNLITRMNRMSKNVGSIRRTQTGATAMKSTIFILSPINLLRSSLPAPIAPMNRATMSHVNIATLKISMALHRPS